MTAVRLDATVFGAVQGVGFRVYVVDVVHRLAMTGWVANTSDGSVRCVVEGERSDLERLLGDLEHGPAGALVDGVRAAWMPATGEFTDFSIRSGWHGGD